MSAALTVLGTMLWEDVGLGMRGSDPQSGGTKGGSPGMITWKNVDSGVPRLFQMLWDQRKGGLIGGSEDVRSVGTGMNCK